MVADAYCSLAACRAALSVVAETSLTGIPVAKAPLATIASRFTARVGLTRWTQ